MGTDEKRALGKIGIYLYSMNGRSSQSMLPAEIIDRERVVEINISKIRIAPGR